MRRSLIFLLIALLLLIAGGLVWIQFNKPHRDVSNESAIKVNPDQLVALYGENEHLADSLYLDKTIEVTGIIDSVYKNQEGKPVISFQTEDPFYGVICTLKDSTEEKSGVTVTIRGICSGFLSDVILRDGIIIEP